MNYLHHEHISHRRHMGLHIS